MSNIKVDTRITNVVLSLRIDIKLNLYEISKKVLNVIYKPKTFSGMILRHRKIRGTCLVFSNGKLITNGCHTMREAIQAARQFARFLQKYQNDGQLKGPIKTVTISALAKANKKLDLIKMVKYCGADYEPERFNAATIKKSGMHFSIFSSGNVVITGAKSANALYTKGKESILEFMAV